MQPHPGFSRASRRIRLRVSAASGGRPSLRRRRRRSPCRSARCQRRSVCGLTAKQAHRSGGSRRLTATSKARSAVLYCGRFPARLRITSWWRRTMISSSRSPPPRASTRTRPQSSRYSKDISTTRSLNRLHRDHQHARPGRIEFLYPTRSDLGRASLGRRRESLLHASARRRITTGLIDDTCLRVRDLDGRGGEAKRSRPLRVAAYGTTEPLTRSKVGSSVTCPGHVRLADLGELRQQCALCAAAFQITCMSGR